ncbi:hypothetical protein [Streptomyces sp.]|uniref:hypothetical protein n=1 Tax=Streptomyces sp. TaxID=1931 RepID=UPI002F40CE29
MPTPALDGSDGLDLQLGAESFRHVFAGDVPEATTRLLAATRRPVSASTFGDQATAAAWRTVPSWHTVPSWSLVAGRSERPGYPARTPSVPGGAVGARSVEVDSSHLPLLSRPDAVTGLITAAAGSVRD